MSGRNATATIFLALNAAAGAPDWIMLVPAGKTITTVDGRGPYRVGDPARLAAASLQAAGGKLPIDENHAIDLAAPEGRPSPARGWIVEMQARADGIFGRVEWTDTGKQLFAEQAYRGISPALAIDKNKNVVAVLRASLTNVPNLRGMAALHAQGDIMEELMQQLRDALGLPADADATAIVTACKGAKSSVSTNAILAPIAKAAGLKEDADATAIVGAITTLQSAATARRADTTVVEGLRTELASVTTTLNTLRGDLSKEKATAFVDGAIKAGRVGVKPMRDHYIAMHAADPARVEKEINAMPILGPSGALPTPPVKIEGGEVSLNAEQINAAKLLGIDPKKYAATLAAERASA